jgi:hypothetical protein
LVISNIRDMIQNQLAYANQMLMSLCEDLNMSTYNTYLKKHLNSMDSAHEPKDPLHKYTHEYSFINDPDNPCLSYKHDVIRKIMETCMSLSDITL